MPIDQLANYLRQEILGGTLQGNMPRIKQLFHSLGVNSVAVAKALQQLELEGLVIHQGSRRIRRIVTKNPIESTSLKIGML